MNLLLEASRVYLAARTAAHRLNIDYQAQWLVLASAFTPSQDIFDTNMLFQLQPAHILPVHSRA